MNKSARLSHSLCLSVLHIAPLKIHFYKHISLDVFCTFSSVRTKTCSFCSRFLPSRPSGARPLRPDRRTLPRQLRLMVRVRDAHPRQMVNRQSRPRWRPGEKLLATAAGVLTNLPDLLPSAVKTCTGHTRQGISNERAFKKICTSKCASSLLFIKQQG